MTISRFDQAHLLLYELEVESEGLSEEVRQGDSEIAYLQEVLKAIVVDPEVPDRHVEAALAALKTTGGLKIDNDPRDEEIADV